MHRYNPNAKRYSLEFPGLLLELDCEAYPGSGDADILGDSRWTFQREDLERAGLLAPDPIDGRPYLFVRSNMYRSEERPLLEALAGDRFGYPEDEEERAEWETAEEWESDNIDACIVTLRALMDRAEERYTSADASADAGITPPERWTVRVQWYGECSAFWAFHDITHAREDVYSSDGSGEIYLEGAYAEDRANLEGARRAVRAGVPVEEVLAELAGLRGAFRDRFGGEESTALADFLAGESGDEDAGEAYRASVLELAAEVLDAADEDEDLDTVRERAHEYADGAVSGMSAQESARVLVHTSNAERGEDWADGDSTALEARAFGAFLGDVEDALAELFEAYACTECEERLPASGRRICGDCARAYTPEELEEREREEREALQAEDLEKLQEEEDALQLADLEPHAVRVLALEPASFASLQRLTSASWSADADIRMRAARVLQREPAPVNLERLAPVNLERLERLERTAAQDEARARAVRAIREEALQAGSTSAEGRALILAHIQAEEEHARAQARASATRADAAFRAAHRAERLERLERLGAGGAEPASEDARRTLRVLLERDARLLGELEEEPHGTACAQRVHGAAECTCGKSDALQDAERIREALELDARRAAQDSAQAHA